MQTLMWTLMWTLASLAVTILCVLGVINFATEGSWDNAGWPLATLFLYWCYWRMGRAHDNSKLKLETLAIALRQIRDDPMRDGESRHIATHTLINAGATKGG